MDRVLEKLASQLERKFRPENGGSDREWRSTALEEAKSILDLCRKQGISVISTDHPEYPENLRSVRDCPELLFVKGRLTPADRIAVAMVGTRNPTAVGQSVAVELATELAAAGVTIVSGLAYGIDACVHKAALDAKGRTIACLGQGVDLVYPKANWALYRDIPNAGALVSEYLPGTRPKPWHFPQRNRLISGLSLGVVVVEAGLRSGALITADWALKQGRPVMAVPGSVKSRASQGTNRLIQEGAYLATCAEDVLSFLRKDNEYVPQPETAGPVQRVSLEEALVLNCLTQHESVEEICDNLKEIPVHRTMSLLASLEVKGYIKSVAGGKYLLTPAGQKVIT
ncbi:MAG TPA: DNA-processing protein DprA [Bacillota bacterium]|nr:DNA-protecting protein DprA [Candidatus Fermentithermobacillaceae bacterium]HOA71231.1 DNA-processing protein DprA [Bacillota bacterium]HOP70135.1 DNA-processing protein DprA [Bacillota bacterium]HPT35083.1 DNA-processing protein DprA [Bacillota bacterium]HPZ85804.1 DNA-processing protein DprA [Bacillota bacterium]